MTRVTISKWEGGQARPARPVRKAVKAPLTATERGKPRSVQEAHREFRPGIPLVSSARLAVIQEEAQSEKIGHSVPYNL